MIAIKKNMAGKDDRRFAQEAYVRFMKGVKNPGGKDSMLLYKLPSARIKDIKAGNFYTYLKDSSIHGKWKSTNDDKLTGNFSDPMPIVLWLGYITVENKIEGVIRKTSYGIALNMNLVPPMPFSPHRLVMFNRMAPLLSAMFLANSNKNYMKWPYPQNIGAWKSMSILSTDDPDLAKGLDKFCKLMRMPLPPPNLMIIKQDEIRNMLAFDWSEIFNIYYLFNPANIKYGNKYKLNAYVENLFKVGPKPKIMIVS